MPIVRKLIQVGSSKAVSIPKSWIEYYEKETGRKMESLAMEVNHVLTLKPIFEKTKEKRDSQ